jgi:two-component system capsular synthesis response regulator RcsB
MRDSTIAFFGSIKYDIQFAFCDFDAEDSFTMGQLIRVAVADDHPVILFGIAQALATSDGIKVIGQAHDSTGLVKLLENSRCDVLVTDLSMPGGRFGDGLPLLGYVRRHFPTLRIVVLTMLDNPGLLKRIQEVGVTSVVNKGDELAHVARAVISVMRDTPYFSPSVQQAFDDMGMSAEETAAQVSLSKREFEVVRLFVSGQTIKEIAELLNRSVKTISTQKTSAMRKLGIDRDSDLHQYALSNGLANLTALDQGGTSQPVVAKQSATTK